MKLCTVYGTTLRVHPLFPMLLLLFVLGGQGLLIAAYLLALCFHEAGHVYAASRMGLTVTMIELTPFGGAMQIEGSEGAIGLRGFLLASGGIIVNLIFLPLTYFVLRFHVTSFLVYFLLAHFAMLTFNLIPALPLDGGRMALALLSARFPRARVWRIMLLSGRILACLMVCFSLYKAFCGSYRPTWAILGCYLLYSSFLEEKQSATRYITALFSRRYRADNGDALPMQALCVSKETSLRVILPQLSPRAYHIIAVLDDAACEVTGWIPESKLYDAVLDQPEAKIKDLIN
ncbi:MAG: hypothetical protein IJ664_05540 [Clostridia bacterium]|nr:hypothetical protein [Clostridia bacterium]